MKETYTDLFARERFTKEEQWLKENLLYECIMGSQAYGLATPESDVDIVALVMPKEMHIWPQRYGYIPGFETVPNFNSKEVKGEKNRIELPDSTHSDVEGEWNSLLRFFYLAGIKGSPNLIEILFVRRNLVTFGTDIAWKLRDNAHKFLSMRTFHAFKGYAFQQLARMRRCVERGKAETPKRQEYLDKYGYDIKMGYHPLRLLDQLNQLLDEGTIDLMRNKEECKAMRKGEWGPWDKFQQYVLERLDILEKKALTQNAISPKPRMGELKVLLTECLEDWYGSETKMVKETEFISAKDVWQRFDKLEERLLKQNS
jgi:hypothetical protein